MSDRPLVSVVIPCCKQAEYLSAAVDSALAQTDSLVEAGETFNRMRLVRFRPKP